MRWKSAGLSLPDNAMLGQAVSAPLRHGKPRFPTLPAQPNLLQDRCFPTHPAPTNFRGPEGQR